MPMFSFQSRVPGGSASFQMNRVEAKVLGRQALRKSVLNDSRLRCCRPTFPRWGVSNQQQCGSMSARSARFYST
jgi:hypothetical protein